MKPEPICKSKDTQTEGPDPLKAKVQELYLQLEYLGDQNQHKQNNIDRMQFVIDQNYKDLEVQRNHVKWLKNEMEEYEYRAIEAEKQEKLKSCMVNDMTNDIIQLKKKMEVKDKQFEHLKFEKDYLQQQKEAQQIEFRSKFKKLEGSDYLKSIKINKLEQDLEKLTKKNNEDSESGKLIS